MPQIFRIGSYIIYFYRKAGYNSTDKTAFIQWLEM